MNWNGKELATIGDLSDAMYVIYRLASPEREEEARRFMADYRAESEHAETNIGYLTGYYGAKDADAMRELFDVSHPIFGRKSPTPEEAFEAGKRWARGEL